MNIFDENIHGITKVISGAVLKSALDYFEWTRGRILYDDGAEPLITCAVAKALFDKYGADQSFSLRLEAPVREVAHDDVLFDLAVRVAGRIDLCARFSDLTVLVESKRYTHVANIKNDLDRLIDIVNASKRHNVPIAAYIAACAFEYDDRKFIYDRDYKNQILKAYNMSSEIDCEVIVKSELLSTPTEKRRDTAASVVIRLK